MSVDDPGGGRSRARILVIDDEPVIGLSCTKILRPEGFAVDVREVPEDGLHAALTEPYDLVLLDMRMPRLDGLALLRTLRGAGVTSEVVIVTGYASLQNAVDAMKEGAADYLAKPFTPEELLRVVRTTLEKAGRLRASVTPPAPPPVLESGFEGILGVSRAMQEVFDTVRRVAPTDSTVLLTGESGTGKELVAGALHRLSARRDRPFLACDCTALAPTLLESELFGHVRGSFSGAVSHKQGLFEVAHLGTLFLDEVANLGPETQSKLLRVLESRRVRRVGDTAEREVDIRLVAATNRELGELVARRAFREDLYYRLNVVPLRLPPLRERAGDVPLLARAFLERYRRRNPSTVPRLFGAEALAVLEAYSWPGNVRELRNVVERLAVLGDAEQIAPHHLPLELREDTAPGPHAGASLGAAPAEPLPEKWDEFKDLKRRAGAAVIDALERRFLAAALARTDGNITRAAEQVGMQRTHFHALLRKHGLGPVDD